MWPNSEVRSTGSAGVIKLTLSTDAYGWQFIPIAGKTFTDAGTGGCHDSPATQANPSGPYFSEGTVTFDGTHSFDPQKQYPLTYAWDFGDGTSGTGERPVHTYAAEGTYQVTLTATDAVGNASAPAITTATIGNIAPTVSATSSMFARPGQSLTIAATISDPGLDDAPWGYRVDWGDGGVAETGALSTLADALSLTHTYGIAGSYSATITVTDKDGASGAATVAVTVSSVAPRCRDRASSRAPIPSA